MNKKRFQPITFDFIGSESLTFLFGKRSTGSLFILMRGDKTIDVHFANISMQDIYWDDNRQPIVPFNFADEEFERFKLAVSKAISPNEFDRTMRIRRFDIPPILFIAPLIRLCPKKIFDSILTHNFNKVIIHQLKSNGIGYSTEISEHLRLTDAIPVNLDQDQVCEQAVTKMEESKEFQVPPMTDIRKNLKEILKDYPLKLPPEHNLKM